MLLDIKLYYQVVVTKTACDEPMPLELFNIWKKRGKNIVKIVYSINDVGKTGQICTKTIRPDQLFIPYTRINTKLVKDYIRLKTIKIVEENIGSKISVISHNNIFSDITPWAKETKKK